MSSLKLTFISLFLFTSASNAALLSSYDFDGNLNDSLGNGTALTSKGGVINSGRYDFGSGQGLAFTVSSLYSVNDSYAVEMSFKSTDGWSGYNRLIDWSNLLSDSGLYVRNGIANMYPQGNVGSNSFVNNTDITLGFEYDNSTNFGSLFLNGANVGGWSNTGTFDLDSSVTFMRFFDDNTSHGTSEEFSGSVDFIRFHDDASTFGETPVLVVPEPTSLVLLGLGLAGFGFARKRTTA